MLAARCMKARLAIYDMDRTVTRRRDLHAVPDPRRARGWRPGGCCCCRSSLLAMLAYALKLIDRGRLKEINYGLLIGRGAARPSGSSRWSRASPTGRSPPTSCPAPARAIAADRAAGRRLVMATASYRLYAAAIARAARLRRRHRHRDRARLARAGWSPGSTAPIATARPSSGHDPGLAAARGPRARGGPHPLLFRPCLRRAGPPLVGRGRSPPTPHARAGQARRGPKAGRSTGLAADSPSQARSI